MGKNKASRRHTKNRGYSNKTASTTPLIIMAVALVALAVWIISRLAGPASPPSPPPVAEERNGVQVISMDLSTAGYSPNRFTVKKGIPVQVYTNSTADAGCVSIKPATYKNGRFCTTGSADS